MEHDTLNELQGAAPPKTLQHGGSQGQLSCSGRVDLDNTRPAGLTAEPVAILISPAEERIATGVASVRPIAGLLPAAALVGHHDSAVARLSGRAGVTRIARSAGVSSCTSVARGSSTAGVTRVTRVAGIARGACVAGASRAAGVARVTRSACVAGASHVSRVAGAAGITRVTGVSRCSWGSSGTRTSAEGEHHE